MYVGGWIAASLWLTSYLLWRDLSSGAFSPLVFGFFLVLLVVSEANPVKPSSLDGKIEITVTFIIAILAIMQMQPGSVALASGLAVMASFFDKERSPSHRIFFNAAQSAIAAGLAAVLYRALGGTGEMDPSRLLTILASTGAATGTYFLINSFAVTGAISLSTRAPLVRTWATTHGWLAATYVAFGASGILLASLYQTVGMLAVPLLLVPLLVARQVFTAYDEVSEAYEATVRAFVSAIEAKDSYTKGHSERVADYGTMIAKRMGMSSESLRVFRYGALLHDVGKLAVRRAVLTKPGRLDDSEFDEIKRHPVVGAQLVTEIEFLKPAIPAVLYHHERLDGSGYPAGLVGDMVPPWAKIMAVADTYDAMTSTRAYRGARTHKEAMAELRRCSGTQLDPDCVQAFEDAMAAPVPSDAQQRTYEAKVVPRPAG